ALPRPRRTRRQLEPLDALRQRFELNHGQVPLAVFSDDFALDAFFADVPNVEIALGDQLPFLVHGKENNGSFAVAHNVFVGEHELAADVDDGAGATGILRALRRLSSWHDDINRRFERPLIAFFDKIAFRCCRRLPAAHQNSQRQCFKNDSSANGSCHPCTLCHDARTNLPRTPMSSGTDLTTSYLAKQSDQA